MNEKVSTTEKSMKVSPKNTLGLDKNLPYQAIQSVFLCVFIHNVNWQI
jgi:hypothetical protein